MFQRNKFSYKIVAYCTNGDKEATYEFIESYDATWSDIASDMFYDEFGIRPTRMKLESRERL